jgi:hypothetical protein
MNRFAVGLALAAVFGTAVAGCGRAQAKTPGPAPALVMPEPPSRLVIPVTIEPPAPPPEPPDRSATTPVRTPSARPTPTPSPQPAATPPPATEIVKPPVLQTSGSLAELEARARERLDRAKKDIARVSRTALGTDARDQFDTAQQFIRMAEDAITAKNFFHAAYCADKAATLAGLLVK